ncbi:MAG: type 1 glutamine amidotransferase domain-containing protein [Casimicrobiaceae bacterium]
MPTSRVLIVCTSHASLGTTGERTGLWLEELAAPFWVFRDAGFTVDVVSMAGGEVPLDPRSLEEKDRPAPTQRFLDDAATMTMIRQTRALADVATEDYDAVFLPGGHGTMWDFAADPDLAETVAATYDAGRVVAAVCHGPAGLVGAVRADGKALVAGRRITGFTNAEEAAVGLTDKVPFLLESRLRELGGIFDAGADFKSHVVRDGNLVTGQNPQSSAAVAQAIVEALGEAREDPATAAHQAGSSAKPEARPPRA